jgi:hypothetical protein
MGEEFLSVDDALASAQYSIQALVTGGEQEHVPMSRA